MRKETTGKSIEEKQNRLIGAKKSFQKLQDEIRPFIKKKKFKNYSTAGKWSETSSLYSLTYNIT